MIKPAQQQFDIEKSGAIHLEPMKSTVIEAIRGALGELGIQETSQIEVQVPKEESFGDLASPVAMGLAKELKKNPRAIAESLATVLREKNPSLFEKVEIAGPGFINFTMSAEYLRAGVKTVLTEGASAIRPSVGRGLRVQIEFVSANPTGPLHLGHGRGAAVGCALANLLEAAGYTVEREYYINDAGRQVRLLGESVFARYQELLGVQYPFPEDGYQGEYIKDAAQVLLKERGEVYKGKTFGQAETEVVDFSLSMMLGLIKKDLSEFAVEFGRWQSERELYSSGAVAHAIEFLSAKGLMYEHGDALWFKATEFGDDKDRVVVKADGQHTYFASDIAYHLQKVEAGFDEIIDIWGADHHGYIPRLQAVMDALGKGREKLSVLLIQMVSLVRSGVPVQMSKRSGDFITLREVFEEVGSDTTKFIFLTRRHDSQLVFDLEAAKARSAENPVYYVQYAGARISSLFKNAAEQGIELASLASAGLSPLCDEDELRLMRKLLHYRMTLEGAALAREPHRLTFYLQELAGLFHPFYNRHRVIGDDLSLTRARLALCLAVQSVVRDGLAVLGLTSPERM